MSGVRVRFAPSPTGTLHVGGARTALFNWLFAKSHGGKFIVRIEDTDRKRSSAVMVEDILSGLRWLGLDWDEGPFFQSQRLDRYRKVAQQLLNRGKAYHCFCSSAILAAKHNEAISSHRAWKYEGTCRELKVDEVQDKLARRVPSVIRFKSPQRGEVYFEDKVFGRIAYHLEQIDDFILVRSNAMPTYHLGVVLDDIDMGITHVIRGADHISNTPKQKLLYQALDFSVPSFSHLPLILGPDKARLSKRHGSTALTNYRDQGYLPEPFRNFLALLGWSPGIEVELLSTNELIRRFSLEGVNKSNAIFNLEKLDWFNRQYLSKLSAEELLPHVKTALKKYHLWKPDYDFSKRPWLLKVIDLLKIRARMIPDFVNQGRAFFSDDFEIELKARQKFLKDVSLQVLMPELASRLKRLPEFEIKTTETTLRRFSAEKQVKAGLLINASRVLLTGQAVAPGIFEIMVALGQQCTVSRLGVRFQIETSARPFDKGAGIVCSL